MFERLAILSLFAILAGCGSSDDDGDGSGNGGAGGTVANSPIGTAATDACAKQAAAGCPLKDTECASKYVERYEVFEFFSCEASYRKYVECLGQNDWTCESISGGSSWHEPSTCTQFSSDASDCRGSYVYASTGGGAACTTSFILDGQTLGAKCDTGPASCVCSAGSKQGTAFTATSCDQVELLQSVATNCK